MHLQLSAASSRASTSTITAVAVQPHYWRISICYFNLREMTVTNAAHWSFSGGGKSRKFIIKDRDDEQVAIRTCLEVN
jgi:hypothetical protein